MPYLEEILLYLEIGASFTKALLYKVSWRKTHHILLKKQIPTKGVTINGIEDFPLFSQTLKEIILEIEYETSEKIYQIVVLYGGLLSVHNSQNSSVQIKRTVQERDISRYEKPTITSSNYEVVHYNYYFTVDHFLYMKNPVGIECSNLTITQNYLLLNKTVYKNIFLFFEKQEYKLVNLFFGPYVLVEYIKQYLGTFLLIDVGSYTSRICLIENKIMREFYILNTGVYHMVQFVQKTDRLSEEDLAILLKTGDLFSQSEGSASLQGFLLKLFEKILKMFASPIVYSVDIPIFINGLEKLHPLEYFLQIKMNREFFKISTYFHWPSSYEYLYAIHSIFMNQKKQ